MYRFLSLVLLVAFVCVCPALQVIWGNVGVDIPKPSPDAVQNWQLALALLIGAGLVSIAAAIDRLASRSARPSRRDY